MSKLGKDRREDVLEVGIARELVRHRPDERRDEGADEGEPDPPGERPRQLVAERPADRAADAEDGRRNAREREAGGDPEVAAREQLDPDGEEDDGNDPHEREGQPVVLADERDVVGRPAERAQGRDGAEDVEAVRDPQDDHQEAGDTCGAGAAEQGSERERQAAEEQGEEAGPEGETDRRQKWDLVAERGVAEHRGAGRGEDGEDRHRQGQHRHVGCQLL